MAGSPNLPLFPLGILRVRDLVQLYYGVRMVTSVSETHYGESGGQLQLLGQDTRRIKYTIVVANFGDDPDEIGLWTNGGADAQNPQIYSVLGNATLVVERTFLTDLDSIALPVFAFDANGTASYSVREVFLTPLPLDEPPVG